METYIVDINECIVGLIASPLSVEEDSNLMKDTILQLMVKTGFSSIAEYQSNLPGHSDEELGGFDEPYDRTLRYNLLGIYNDNHPIGIALYRNRVADDDLFKDLRTIFFDAGKYDNCCAFILQPTVEDMKQVVRCLNYKTDEYFKYCSDWKEPNKFINDLKSVIHTFEGGFACIFLAAICLVSITNYFDKVPTHFGRFCFLLLLDIFFWVNGIIKANPGSNIIPDWMKRLSESIFPSKP